MWGTKHVSGWTSDVEDTRAKHELGGSLGLNIFRKGNQGFLFYCHIFLNDTMDWLVWRHYVSAGLFLQLYWHMGHLMEMTLRGMARYRVLWKRQGSARQWQRNGQKGSVWACQGSMANPAVFQYVTVEHEPQKIFFIDYIQYYYIQYLC